MGAVTLVHHFKSKQEDRDKLLEEARGLLERGAECDGKHHLMLFYFSLLLLYLDKDCVQVI